MWKWVIVVICVLFLGTAGYCTDYEQARKSAEQLSKAGDRLGAAALLERTIGTDTGAEAEWVRGYIGILRKSPDRDVMSHFLNVADRFPESQRAPVALLRVGYLRDKTGGDPSQDWERLVRDYPHTKAAAEALHRLGRIALRDGDPVLAAERFDQSAAVTEAAPGLMTDSMTQAGYAFISQYWKTANHEILRQAITRLSKAKTEISDSARNARARMGLGEVYLIQGFNDKAAVEYQAVVDSEPRDAYTRSIAQFELGCAQFGKKDYTSALASLDSFLSGCQGSTAKEKDVAWRAARPGYAELVARDADKAAKLCGLDLISEALCLKAHALIQLGRTGEAAPLCSVILADFPKAACADRAKQLLTLCNALHAR